MVITKTVSLAANSTTSDGQTLASFNASVSPAGTNSSMSIMDQQLYDANKELVRSDKAQFDKEVFAVEDLPDFSTPTTTTTTTTTTASPSGE